MGVRASEADAEGAEVSALDADSEDDGLASGGGCDVLLKAGAGSTASKVVATGSGWG